MYNFYVSRSNFRHNMLIFRHSCVRIYIIERRILMAKKYSISETTRVQREKIANDALSTLDAPEPSADTLELVNEYVKGNMEINDVLQKMIERYRVSV